VELRLLTSVTPVIMFLIRDLRVETEQACLREPNHILMLMNLPFLFLVLWSTMVISVGMCLKSFVIVPLGPLTVTILVFMSTVTTSGQLSGASCVAYLLRGYEPIPQRASSSYCLYLLLY
jgi:hypothetical protein